MKSLWYFLLLALVIGLQTGPISAKQKTADIQPLVDSQHYIFEAQWVQPLAGRARVLTSTYTVTVTRDTIMADLPYFGRAYEAPVDPSQAGIVFTSTKFSYVKKPIKSGWSVVIQPKEAGNSNQLYFTIFNNGSASLQVNSNNRQGISFTGFIKPAAN